MECPNCGSTIEDHLRVEYVEPIYLSIIVRYYNGSYSKLEEPTLTTSDKFGTIGEIDPKKYTVTCTKCNEKILLVDLKDSPHCICGASTTADRFCVINSNNICPKCYRVLMPRICSGCKFRQDCNLYKEEEA